MSTSDPRETAIVDVLTEGPRRWEEPEDLAQRILAALDAVPAPDREKVDVVPVLRAGEGRFGSGLPQEVGPPSPAGGDREMVAEALREVVRDWAVAKGPYDLWLTDFTLVLADAAIAAGAGTGPADDESIRGGRLVIDQKQKYRIKQLEAAVSGLSKLVEGEYPDKYSLGEIADTWGGEYGVTEDEVAAIAAMRGGPDG